MSDILTGTPSSLTYEHELVRQAWTAAWMVATGVLGIALGWMGLTLIVQEHLRRLSAGWKEMIPRLCLGLAAASSSLWWCAMIIDLSDAVSGYLAAALSVTPGDLLRAPLNVLLRAIDAGSVGMGILIAAIYLVYGLFVLIVLAQMIIRLALIDLLLALAPVALGLWILPHAAGWGRHWLRLFMTTVFQQSVQLIALALGFGFLDEFAGITAGYEPAQDLVWKLLMSAAFVYLATRVPSLLGNAGAFDAWVQTIYFGMSMAGGLGRSAQTLTMLAGTAAGAAIGGASGGGDTASSADGTASSSVRSAAEMSSEPSQSSGAPRSASE